MDLNEIQDLIKFVAKSGVNEVEIEQKDFKITIKSDYLAKKKGGIVSEQPAAIVQQVPVNVPTAQPVAVATPPVQQTTAPAKEEAPAENGQSEAPAADDSKYITIKSPMIGTFYRSSSPDKPPFAAVGDNINTGDVICIVEAMKLFNEIEAEVSGKVVKVLVDDATPIEYDQPLFLIDPS